MAKKERVSHCPAFYELNLAGLNAREMIKAGGWGGGLLCLLLTAIPKLFGITFRTSTFFPEEVTMVWTLPEDEILPPQEVEELGFRVLKVFELPEFSGENATCLLADSSQSTYCEVIYTRSGQESMTGVSFSTHFVGQPRTRVKTVVNWKVNPLDQPEGFLNLHCPGSLTQAYEQHCEYVRNHPAKPLATSWETFFKHSNDDLRTLAEYYLQRRVWVPARNFDVEAMLRKKGIRLP
jgi:hypothetical protein